MALLLSRIADSSPFRWAAALSLSTMCQWLIAKGYTVNQASTFFRLPLLAAVAGSLSVVGPYGYTRKPWDQEISRQCQYKTVNVLLEAGADCHAKVHDQPDRGALTKYNFQRSRRRLQTTLTGRLSGFFSTRERCVIETVFMFQQRRWRP